MDSVRRSVTRAYATIDEPFFVDSDTADPSYGQPTIDSDQYVNMPLPHREVNGHFAVAPQPTRFTFYFPPRSAWRQRFFQHVYVSADETTDESKLVFALSHGAYQVQVTGTSGYRHAAAVAMFARSIAAEMYRVSVKAITGVIYGGSNGSHQVFGAMENTVGVWQGGVAYVPSVPSSILTGMPANALAALVLDRHPPSVHRRLAFDGPDACPELSEMEKAVVHEILKMGRPLRSFETIDYADQRGMLAAALFAYSIPDKTYGQDFWSQPGYLGTEVSDLGDFFRRHRLTQSLRIHSADSQDGSDKVPIYVDGLQQDVEYLGCEIHLLDENGQLLHVAEGNVVLPDRIEIANAVPEGQLEAATHVRLDNSYFLACHSYNRHQVPPDPQILGWQHYRNADGSPRYPQRPRLLGPCLTRQGGCIHSGRLQGKLVVSCNLVDMDNYPQFGHWYRQQVEAAMGADAVEHFRIYFHESSAHLDGPLDRSLIGKTVQIDALTYRSVLELVYWLEGSKPAAPSTRYRLDSGQIHLDDNTVARGGFQPIVQVAVDGKERTSTLVGVPVHFVARVSVPTGQGTIVSVKWDWKGDGVYERAEYNTGTEINVEAWHVYEEQGSFVAAILVDSAPPGQNEDQSALVANLGRVRVTVT